ncbi:hypothetical protein [Vallitalea guaymasensis]|uniref:hypothetical protein n=1 Tax=Vallitalea guaymasensis TaxID=1185412 RepID=UPI000DE4D242|nr:hypothetical protein [Vallitalea guaymasensis]
MKNKEKKHVNKLSRLVDSNIESLTRIYKEAVKDLQLKLFTYEKHEATYTNINNLIKELDTTINQYDKKLYGYVNGENQDKGLTENSYMEGIKSSSKLLSVKGNFTNVNHRAIAFMQGYTFNLIKDINDNLRINLRKSLQLGILKGDSIPDIAKSIVTYLGEEIGNHYVSC